MIFSDKFFFLINIYYKNNQDKKRQKKQLLKKFYINITVPCYISIFSLFCIHCIFFVKYNIATYLVFGYNRYFPVKRLESRSLSPFTRHLGHLIACDKFYANLVRL